MTRDDVWKWIRHERWRGRAQLRLRRPEDKLGVQAPPLDEAGFCRSSVHLASFEAVMHNLPDVYREIIWLTTLKHSEFMPSRKSFDVDELIAQSLGMSASEMRALRDRAIGRMVDTLNGETTDVTAEALTA